jgi:hypothetical protein
VINLNIGERIRKIRIEKGMTQKEIAEKCGINDANIRKYESGRQNPKIDTIEKIAKALDVEVSELLFEKSEIIEQLKNVLNTNAIEAIKTTHQLDEDTRNGKITWREATPDEVLQMSVDSANYLRNDTISKYDSLNDTGKQKANEYITDLSEQEKYTNK